MNAPFVGLPTAATDGTCAYASDIDSASCGQPATIHIVGRSAAWGWVSLYSCEAHQRIAYASCSEISDAHRAAGCPGDHFAPSSTEETP